MTDASQPQGGELVARADFQYRWRVYLFFVVLFGWGLWSLYDGFVNWPRENARWDALRADNHAAMAQKNHTSTSILLNQVLGIALPAISLPLFIWLMYRSRGEYRLTQDTLHVPGHPPIALDRVQALDKSRWDRKGIAVVEYESPDGGKRAATLRDMVYHRRTTDQIVDRIEEHLNPKDVPGASG